MADLFIGSLTGLILLLNYSKRYNKCLFPFPAKSIYVRFCRGEKDISNVVNHRKKGVDMIGMLAVSRAGHDSMTTYVITGEDGEYVYLADGRIRTVDRPKKKKKKHIQIIKKVQMKKPEDGFRDSEIRKAIKNYQEEADVKSRCN